MRDSDHIWMSDHGSHKSIGVISEGQRHRLGFDLRPRAERLREARNEQRRRMRKEKPSNCQK